MASEYCPRKRGAVKVNVDLCQKITYIGPPGAKGSRGKTGYEGDVGEAGYIGPIGPMGEVGPIGVQGDLGNWGNTGVTGLDGYEGIQGLTGLASYWYVNAGCETPTGSFREPVLGDLLLDLESREICQYDGTGWTGTGKTLKMQPDCEDVYSWIKEIEEQPDTCTFSFSVIDCPPLFHSGNLRITRLIINGEEVEDTVSLGSFSTPQELATVLAKIGWQSINSFDTYIYLFQQTTDTDPAQSINRIVFSNNMVIDLTTHCQGDVCYGCEYMDQNTYLLADGFDSGYTGLSWVSPICLGVTGATGADGKMGSPGPDGLQGLPGETGVTGPPGPVPSDVYNVLLGLDSLTLTDCQYCGTVNPVCLNFFTQLDGSVKYAVATAYKNLNQIVGGPAEFRTQVQLNIALTALHITIKDGFVRVLKSDGLIDRIYFYRTSDNTVISEILLTSINCCPTGIDENNQVLVKDSEETDELSWAPGKCVFKPAFDIETAICSLPPFGKYKCTITFDAVQPFLKNQNFPWLITSLILFDNNVTSLYSEYIYNFKDLARILTNQGWKRQSQTNGKFTYCLYSDTDLSDTISHIRITDASYHIFYCEDFDHQCGQAADGELQLIFQGVTGLTGCETSGLTGVTGVTGVSLTDEVVLGTPNKFFDLICNCTDTTYTCTANVNPQQVINDMMVPAPWRLDSITVAEVLQPVATTQFSGALQLTYLLQSLGWILNTDTGGLSLTIDNLTKPSTISNLVIASVSGPTQTVNLPTMCQADCSLTDIDRMVLSKSTNGDFCFMNPNCFHRPVVQIDCCTGCTGLNLEDIGDCSNITPEYDIFLEIRKETVNLISCHFGKVAGPYWIQGYRIANECQFIGHNVEAPLSLQTLAKAFQELGWVTDPAPHEITSETEILEILKNNYGEIIEGVCINLANQEEFPFIIPTQHIKIECFGLPPDGRLLIEEPGLSDSGVGLGVTGATGVHDYCFVDIDCIVPQIPPPIDLEKELCRIDECDEDCPEPLCPTGMVSPPCSDQIIYVNCIEVNQTDVNLLISYFGTTELLQIVHYELVNGKICEFAHDIGVNPTLMDLVSAFETIGWVADYIAAPDIKLKLTSPLYLKYVAIHHESGIEPPYPYKIGANCLSMASCPNQVPGNSVLIQKPDETVCWTPVCPNTGPTGEMGPTGWQGHLGFTGPTGTLGPAGSQGPQGPQGPTGSTGTTGAEGAEGVQGPPGDSNQILDCGNTGEGVSVCAGRTGPTGPFTGASGATGPVLIYPPYTILQFRSLIEGKNLDFVDTVDDITIKVSDSFEWGSTDFYGGTTGGTGLAAIVEAPSSITFEDGALVQTDNIEETSAANGVKIDTSNGVGVCFKDGGTQFENNLTGVSGPSPRSDFLEYYKAGVHVTDWKFNAPPPNDLTFEFSSEIPYHRIGNVVTLFIPEFVNGATGPNPSGSASIYNVTDLPDEIKPSSIQYFMINYEDPAKAASASYPGGPPGSHKLGTLSIAAGSILINKDLDDTGFFGTDTFSNNEAMVVRYLVT